jgi:hypothetical protein
MGRGDLDVGLLHLIMVKLGELRETSRPFNPTTEGHLMPLASERSGQSGQAALNHLQRHMDYLAEKAFLKIVPGAPLYRILKLTAKGQAYLQPELVDFGEKPILPEVVKNLENKIAILTYPETEKLRMVHALREALADKAPELFAKVLVEVGARLSGV